MPYSFIFDTETSGLPVTPRYGEYYDYWDLECYNCSRIVQISYIVSDDDYNIIEDSNTIIKRDRFNIDNSRFHGITNEISDTEGIEFVEFSKTLYTSLKRCNRIVAHNIDFDINVLRSELYRYNLHYIIELIDTMRFICTMKVTKRMVNATFKNSITIKDPNLKELYFYATGERMENHHNSYYDTLNLFTIIKKLKLI